MQSIERSMESTRTSRNKELTVVLVQLFDKRVPEEFANVVLDFECQVTNVFCEFAC